jgi:hypothetical protein
MGRHVGFESWLERDWLMLLDFDPQVVAFSSQPFWLCWNTDEQRRTHAPDFFARTAYGDRVVIDCRPHERIKPRDAEAFEATSDACQIAGWEYHLETGAWLRLTGRGLGGGFGWSRRRRVDAGWGDGHV